MIQPHEPTELHYRIWSEFQQMPGLRLTLEQASRLWGQEPASVAGVLQDLIDAGVVREIGPYYVRADFASFTA
jgi:hypothetical protein